MAAKPESSDGKCAFFVKRKGRSCRMLATKGSIYCPEHLLNDKDQEESVGKRITCPLDSSHTVYEKDINKHLKKCNASKREVPGCYVANINTGIPNYIPLKEETCNISDFSEDTMMELMGRIDKAIKKLEVPISEDIKTHEVLNDEISSDSNGPTALKHLLQQSSIIGHLDSLGLLSSDSLFIEFGAGRGKLSHWIQLASNNDELIDFLLIDRSNPKRKFDMYHQFDTQGPKFERLLIDIEHLDLGLYQNFKNHKHIVAVSKHLCGSATDLTLRCLTRYHSKRSIVTPPLTTPPLSGIIIALCCHQRCQWDSVYGIELWKELGFNSIDFHLITLMSSWAVCGQRSADKDTKGYIPHTKEPLGLKCKELINLIRVHELRKNGFKTYLLYYVDRKTSLENVLLIALPY